MLAKLKFIASIPASIFDIKEPVNTLYNYFFEEGHIDEKYTYIIQIDYGTCGECNNINFDGFSLWQIE